MSDVPEQGLPKGKDYTWDELQDLPISTLEQIKVQKMDELAEVKQKGWNVIASILYFQDRIKKESA